MKWFENMFSVLKKVVKKSGCIELIFRYFYIFFVDILVRDENSRTRVCPYSELEDKYRVIFVHIPKNAGNGVAESIFSMRPRGHNFISSYQRYDHEKYIDYYKFCFVRCPYDRLYSAYSYLKKGGFGVYDKEFFETYLSKYSSFESFVMALADPSVSNPILRWTHFIPQHKFVCNDAGDILVDFVGRYEELAEGCEYLQVQLNLPKKDVVRVNSSREEGVSAVYSHEMRKIVSRLYEKDFRVFGYAE